MLRCWEFTEGGDQTAMNGLKRGKYMIVKIRRFVRNLYLLARDLALYDLAQ